MLGFLIAAVTPFTVIVSIAFIIAISHFSKKNDYKKVNIFSALLVLLICLYILAVFFNQTIIMVWIWYIYILLFG